MGILRYMLAATVVLWHSGAVFGWHPFNGTASVSYFFVISGFYMTLILTRKYVGHDRLYLFWSNRVMRLWPSFIFVSALIVTVRFDDLAVAYQQLDAVSALLAVFMNTTMIGYEFFDLLSIDESGRFVVEMSGSVGAPAKQFVLLGQGWSIGLEIWLYVMAPFVVRSPLRTVIWLILGAGLFGATGFWVETGIWKYLFFPNIMVFFAIGVLSFHLRGTYRDNPIRAKSILWQSECFFLSPSSLSPSPT